jgi:putative effector of murein hydrolase
VTVLAAVAGTVAAFVVADVVAARLGRPALANPVVWASAALLAGLAVTGVEVDDYVDDARPLIWALGPATVALGAPLARAVRRVGAWAEGVRVVGAVLAGGAVAAAVSALVGAALGATDEVVAVLAAKSVTTPIALAVDLPVDADDGLVAATVVLTGVYGAVLLPWLARRCPLGGDRGVGLGVGTTSHAIGTAELARGWPGAAGWAAAGLALNGALTALWLPPVLGWLL